MQKPEWRRVAVLMLITGLLHALPASAAQQPMYFRHLSLEDGLSQNTVTSILQDSQGFIWLGTESGLNRYDGYAIVRYQHDRADVDGLQGNFIWQIAEDQNNDLWIATADGGLARWDRRSDSFHSYRHDPDDPRSLSEDSVRTVLVGSDGQICPQPSRQCCIRHLQHPCHTALRLAF